MENKLIHQALSQNSFHQMSGPYKSGIVFSNLEYQNTAYKHFPIEMNPSKTPHIVSGYLFSKVNPTPLKNPKILALSEPALNLIGLNKSSVENDKEALEILAGNQVPATAQPIAHCYCGHQFGIFVGQLGDGRAITLGDVIGQGEELWELQLKGSGRTPFSRFADGRAVLRSSIREFLCSEAMWALGIPTTRACSIIACDDSVERDPLYTGDIIMEQCSVVCRMSPTFFRFGSFEVFLPKNYEGGGPSSHVSKELSPKLATFIIKNYYKDIYKNFGAESNEAYFNWFTEIVKRTAELTALWQCYGFCHGVLNTDNMSILGVTIDYGPFRFMDFFEKNLVSNHSDKEGMYRFSEQPENCKWNCLKLAEALYDVIDTAAAKTFVNENFFKIYKNAFMARMRLKLGLLKNSLESDEKLIEDFFETLSKCSTDLTNSFHVLEELEIAKEESEKLTQADEALIEKLVGISPPVSFLKKKLKPKVSEEQLNQLAIMAESQPMLLAMMGISWETLDAEIMRVKKWKESESKGAEEIKQEFRDHWAKWILNYKNRLVFECGTNDNLLDLSQARIKAMRAVNPRYVLRNHLAQHAIETASKGDFSEVNKLLGILLNPFEALSDKKEDEYYTSLASSCNKEVCISCSS